MEEIWREIPGYEGLYEASNLGKIRSAEGKTTSSARFPKRVWKQRVLKPKTETNAYGRTDERVSLWKDGVEKTHLVSRLVAMAFCHIPYEKLTVNHINGDPMDNRVENLEWVTLKENIQHGYETGLYDSVKRPVTLIDEVGREYHCTTMSEASRLLGKNVGYISNVVAHGRTVAYDEWDRPYTVKLKQR